MNDDMPWVDLTPEEIQELRSKKHELTEYGKQKIRELMSDGKLRFYDKGKETFAVEDPYWGGVQTPKTQLHIKEMNHEEMIEIAAQREAANEVIVAKVSEEDYKKVQEEIANKKALEELDKLYDENGDALQQLAAIEREELLEKMNSQAIQTAIAGIDKYSDALKELRKIEHEELIEELQAKKKENFQLVADACMENYKKRYGELPSEDEYWRFLVSDYCATGEGRTIRILCTQANLSEKEDFGNEPYDYTPRTSKEYRAVREFHKYFGTWSLYGVEFLSREDLFEKYANFLPPALVNLKDKQCFLAYHGELHFNFS